MRTQAEAGRRGKERPGGGDNDTGIERGKEGGAQHDPENRGGEPRGGYGSSKQAKVGQSTLPDRTVTLGQFLNALHTGAVQTENPILMGTTEQLQGNIDRSGRSDKTIVAQHGLTGLKRYLADPSVAGIWSIELQTHYVQMLDRASAILEIGRDSTDLNTDAALAKGELLVFDLFSDLSDKGDHDFRYVVSGYSNTRPDDVGLGSTEVVREISKINAGAAGPHTLGRMKLDFKGRQNVGGAAFICLLVDNAEHVKDSAPEPIELD